MYDHEQKTLHQIRIVSGRRRDVIASCWASFKKYGYCGQYGHDKTEKRLGLWDDQGGFVLAG